SPTLTRGRRQWRNGGERAPERHERDGPTPPIEAMRCRSEATKTKRCAVGKMLAMRCRSAPFLLVFCMVTASAPRTFGASGVRPGTLYSVIRLGLFGESSAILLAFDSINQMLPVFSTAIAAGAAPALSTANSATALVVGLILPTWSAAASVNQRFPSAGSDTI